MSTSGFNSARKIDQRHLNLLQREKKMRCLKLTDSDESSTLVPSLEVKCVPNLVLTFIGH